eukprot:7821800-Heterocapsa_arctica.AAC.1
MHLDEFGGEEFKTPTSALAAWPELRARSFQLAGSPTRVSPVDTFGSSPARDSHVVTRSDGELERCAASGDREMAPDRVAGPAAPDDGAPRDLAHAGPGLQGPGLQDHGGPAG